MAEVAPLDPERVPVRDALGRVIADDVTAPLALPPWDNASMDGYAVRANDIRGANAASPVVLRVAGTIAAGSSSRHVLAPGEALRIMTGAPVPAGADSVVRVEDTEGFAGGVSAAQGLAGGTGTGEGVAAQALSADPHTVRIVSDRDALKNIRTRGEDIAEGDVAVARGTLLHPAHLGMLASVGCASVRVHRRPRVAVLASGDELVDVSRFSEVLAGAKIVTSNSYTLEGAVREAGGELVSLGIVGDDPVALRERLTDLECDLLLTTGGVSVGAFDFTRSVLAELGATMRFWRVRMRPGAPVGFGLLRGIPWLGLPGNPVSTLVTFELFARPALRVMQGHSRPFRRLVRVRTEETITISAPLTHFLRAVVQVGDDGLRGRLTGAQGSGMLSSMGQANALFVVPAERTRIEAGDLVDALLLRDETMHAAHSGL